jgi:hypothetical protein
MNQEINNWRKFVSLEKENTNLGVVNFYKNPPTADYITEVLGIKVYRRNIQTNFNNFTRRVMERVPSLQNIVRKIGEMINSAFEKVEGLGGWKSAMATLGIIVAFGFIQQKFGDLFKDEDADEEATETGVKSLMDFMVNSMGIESIADKLKSSLTNIQNYFEVLGPIVGGVKTVADSLAGVTRPFVQKYVEDAALDLSGA